MNHLRLPLSLGEEHESMCQVLDADGRLVATARGCSGIRLPDAPDVSPHAVAERIVACVNACQGVEAGELGKFRRQIVAMEQGFRLAVSFGVQDKPLDPASIAEFVALMLGVRVTVSLVSEEG